MICMSFGLDAPNRDGTGRMADHSHRGPAMREPDGRAALSLRQKINLIFTVLSVLVLGLLAAVEIHAARSSVREEIAASNRIATQLLGQLAAQVQAQAGTFKPAPVCRLDPGKRFEQTAQISRRKSIACVTWSMSCPPAKGGFINTPSN